MTTTQQRAEKRWEVHSLPPEPGKVRRFGSWWGSSPKVMWFCSIFILAIFAGLILKAVWPTPTLNGSDAAPDPSVEAAAPAPSSQSDAAPPAAPAPTSVCAPADPVQVPPELVIGSTYDTNWTAVGYLAAPSSVTGGPAITDGIRQCFTRTPEGALYSAASFAAQMVGAATNTERLALADARASHAGSYAQYSAGLAADTTQNAQPLLRFAGYRWVSYTPDAASMEIRFTVLSGDQVGKPVTTVFSLTWEGNDWRLIVPGIGDDVHPADAALRTFTPWGGI